MTSVSERAYQHYVSGLLLSNDVQTLEKEHSKLKAQTEKDAAAIRVRDGQIDRLIERAKAAGDDCSDLRRRIESLVDLVRRLQDELNMQARSEYNGAADYFAQCHRTAVKLEALYMAKSDPVKVMEGEYLLQHMVVSRPERARIMEFASKGPLSDRAIELFAYEVGEKMAEKIREDVSEQIKAQKRGEPSRW